MSINKSYAKASVTLSMTNENAYLGGIVGTISASVNIINSAYKTLKYEFAIYIHIWLE